MMHPAIDYELIKARIADLQRQAEQDAAAWAAFRARQGHAPHRLHRAAVLTRRVLAAAAIRARPAPARQRRLPGCQPPTPCRACL